MKKNIPFTHHYFDNHGLFNKPKLTKFIQYTKLKSTNIMVLLCGHELHCRTEEWQNRKSAELSSQSYSNELWVILDWFLSSSYLHQIHSYIHRIGVGMSPFTSYRKEKTKTHINNSNGIVFAFNQAAVAFVPPNISHHSCCYVLF